MTTITLPFPPSINALYRSVGGRSIMSKTYRDWKTEAGLLMNTQHVKPVTGPVSIVAELCPPDKRRRDIDNVGFKAILDLLVSHGIIEGDDGRFVRGITARWVEGGPPCTVTVEPISKHPSAFFKANEAKMFAGMAPPKVRPSTDGGRG